MLNKRSWEEDAFREALGATKDCPPLEELERLASGQSQTGADFSRHVKSCSYCQTELHLLQSFQTDEGSASREVQKMTAELARRSKEIFQPTAEQVKVPWWRSFGAMRRLAQASLAVGLVLVVGGVVLQFRSSHEPLSRIETGQEVLRSGEFAVISPAGDLPERPTEIRWKKVPNAAIYRVRLLEVDRAELWKAETTEDHIVLPASVRERIVPAKTLFCEVSAFDAANNNVGNTGLVRFRLLQPAGSL
jgi:hypothetical protein